MFAKLFAIVAVARVAFASGTIDPDSVDLATRKQWCTSQKAACPLLCLQLQNTTSDTESNTCDPETLTYSCVCSNGASPNETEYTETIPYFICTEYNNQCVDACGSDSTCAYNCRVDNPCGAQDPANRVNTTTTSSVSTVSSTATSSATETVYSGFAGDDSSDDSSSSSGKSAAMRVTVQYGSLLVLSGVIGAFALLL